MELTKTIYSKGEILEALHTSFEKVIHQVNETPDDIFYHQENEKWSVAENLEHLIQSNKPIASVLKKSKILLRAFGVSSVGSKNYETIKANYQSKLNTGGVAPSKFVPLKIEEKSKDILLSNWKMIGEKYPQRLENWSEKDLDKYRLPHPLLGKLTVREMLFFTIYHNYHHLQAIQKNGYKK